MKWPLGIAVMVLFGCAESESAREERAMKAAVPERLLPDGTVQLSGADREALGLVVAEATEGELAKVQSRFGVIRSRLDDEALVVSPVAGQLRRPPLVALGTSVQVGTPLLELLPLLGAAERLSVGVQSADLEGQLAISERELETREAELARARELAKSNIVSQSKLQETETAVVTTRARLEALRRARGATSQGTAGLISLRAPIAGVVVRLDAALGASVHSGEVLVRILKSGPRWVDVSVPISEPVGDVYEVSVGDRWLPARLLAQAGVAEADGTRHDRVELLEGDEHFLPGAIASVRIGKGGAKGIVLPESALVPGVGAEIVYIEVAQGKFAARAVQVAARFQKQVRLAAGVRPGERVVTHGVMGLRGETMRSALRHQE